MIMYPFILSLPSYVDLGPIPGRHYFGLYLFTRVTEFAWKMLAVLSDWLVCWLFLLGVGATQ